MIPKRGLVPTILPEQNFSWTCSFRKVLDNVKLIRYMKFQKILMTGYRAKGKNFKNVPRMRGFPICDPHDFF